MRLGILGGTFDPPHLGHLVVAQELHGQLGLDRLLLIPAAVPPHKCARGVSAPEARLEMLRAAVSGDDRFEVSEIELGRSGPSYTVDTLRELRQRDPDAEIFLALGADQLVEFGSWKEPDEIAAASTLVIFARSGQEVPPTPGLKVRIIELPELHISSTMIRRRVADGRPIRYLVLPAVDEIIRRLGLYVDATT